MNLIDLKERIAISDAFTPEERDFILDAINDKARRAAIVHAPRNYMGRIDVLWAVLSVDDGGEGVVAGPFGPGGMTIPMVAADKARLDSLLVHVPAIARAMARVLRLAKFTVREDVEIYRP